ncbi:protein SAAL1 isoform X1 [Selaginella moellendorffii]|uniref:protein SAAL1 isoform X1 n=1 Tax=Selaginella moellendorffii TaxID=88036 RepID=UPI000D1C92B7|nr:protein SAAL1 isoform X1 [Selaginella moellendorffii]|eukprot:XP_024515401.1 protein SAAL1 isoform X1 [Selaginella moellendorffii]
MEIENGGKELCDSTLVDPSYVIHLIREMIPQSSCDEFDATEDTAKDDPSAEAGCVLWDLAANDSLAKLMVDNYILDVILGILQAPKSDRIREICLGILGNLAFHEELSGVIAENRELLSTVVLQLFVTDAQTLVETCRLINVGLHSKQIENWIGEINTQETLEHILWIAENTLNEQLVEKVLELLLTMVDSEKKTAAVFLPGLVKSGIVSLLAKLTTSQVEGITQGSILTGSVLESLLQLALEVSLSDEFSGSIADDNELKAAVFQVVHLSWKDEVGVAAVTAMVLVANLLSQKPALAKELCEDAGFMERLLALKPLTENDDAACNALSSIIQRIEQQKRESILEAQRIR